MGAIEHAAREHRGFVIGERPGRPAHAVLAVQLGTERGSGQTTVEALLCQPGCELSVPIEATPRPHVSNQVVDSPEPVIGTTTFGPEKWVRPAAVRGGRDLEYPRPQHGSNHLLVGLVR